MPNIPRSIRRALIPTLLAAPMLLGAQPTPLTGALRWSDSARVAIDAAAIAGDAAAMQAARALVERALTAFPGDALLLHYRGYALYREASQLVGQGSMTAATPLLEQAATVLEQSAKKRPMAETSALLAMVYGSQVAADPSKGMTLGMLAAQLMGEASGMGPTNPRVALMRGMSALFTPPEYGGGVPLAREHLTSAIALFEKDRPAPGMPAWGRAESHVWLGQVLLRGGDTTHAVAEYRAALALAPDYAWVKNGLLPPLVKVVK